MTPLKPLGGRGDSLALGRSGQAGRRGPGWEPTLTAPLPAVLIVACSVAALAVAALCWYR